MDPFQQAIAVVYLVAVGATLMLMAKGIARLTKGTPDDSETPKRGYVEAVLETVSKEPQEVGASTEAQPWGPPALQSRNALMMLVLVGVALSGSGLFVRATPCQTITTSEGTRAIRDWSRCRELAMAGQNFINAFNSGPSDFGSEAMGKLNSIRLGSVALLAVGLSLMVLGLLRLAAPVHTPFPAFRDGLPILATLTLLLAYGEFFYRVYLSNVGREGWKALAALAVLVAGGVGILLGAVRLAERTHARSASLVEGE